MKTEQLPQSCKTWPKKPSPPRPTCGRALRRDGGRAPPTPFWAAARRAGAWAGRALAAILALAATATATGPVVLRLLLLGTNTCNASTPHRSVSRST
jgi:hypothetical protein